MFARQLLVEVDGLGALVVRKVGAAVREELAFERGTGFVPVDGLHHGVHPLAHLGIGDAEHRDVVHLRVFDQQVLGFLRIDVHAARHDHERLAVGEEQVALVVEIAHVADRRPALCVERVARLRFVFVVFEPGSRRRRFEPHRADFARRQHRTVVVDDVDRTQQRLADRTGMGEPIGRGDVGAARAFGCGVVLVDDRTPPVEHLALGLDAARRGRVQRDLHRRQVVLRARLLGQLQHAHEHRRHPLRMGDPVLLDQGERGFGIEVLHDDRGAAEAHRREAVEQRRRVIQRRGREVDRILVHAPDVGDHPHLDGLFADRLARDLVLHPLRPPGRPRRIQHARAFELLFQRRGRIARERGFVVVVALDRSADREADLHVGHLAGELDRELTKLGADHDCLRVAVVDDVRDFVGGEVRVDACVEEARALRGPARFEVLDAVLHHDCDVVAETEPCVPEELRELIRAVIQLAVGARLTGARHDVREMLRPLRRMLPRPHSKLPLNAEDASLNPIRRGRDASAKRA